VHHPCLPARATWHTRTGLLLLLAATGLAAQEAQRIEITGSAIKRNAANAAGLPVTTLRADELRATGVTTVEEAVSRIVSSQSINNSAGAIGAGTGGASYAALRALAPNKTLVLLNGRRVAMFAFGVAGVDLNTIPFSVVERVEILRDGASAIYGTDAIGGVINFITRNDYTGLGLAIEAIRPTGPGGDSHRASVSAGWGSLQDQRLNIWVAFDRQERQRLRAIDREFSRTGVIPSRGVSGTSPTTFPGNFTQNATGVTGNLTGPGCEPPFSLPSPTSSNACVFDFTATIDTIPDVDIDTWLLRGSALLGEQLLSVEHTGSKTTTVARVAPDPVGGISIAPNNPFYPSNWPGLNTALPVTAGWRMIPAGPRTNESLAESSRTVIDLSGVFAGWDHKAGLYSTTSTASDSAVDGYVDAAFVRNQVTAGRLSPFAQPTPEQLQIIEQAKRRGRFTDARGSARGLDFRVSRELFALGGGAAAASLGIELRRENYRSDTDDAIVAAIPSAGRSPYHVRAKRGVKALTGELLLPLSGQLELQLALRHDRYSSVGGSTNPKLALRYMPTRALVLRGSYNTGFRAPTLDEQNGPKAFTFAQTSTNDPLLCPGGVANIGAGGVQSRDCGRQAQVQTGGNEALKPEKSRTYSMGIVFDAAHNLTLSADYWNIDLRDQINAFPNESILNDAARYASRIVRCAALPVAVQDTLDRCLADNRNSQAIGYLIALTDNIGRVQTEGVDLTAAGSWQSAGWGNFVLTWDATWVRRYQYQNAPDEAFKQAVGVYVDSFPVLRWQHALALSWRAGDLSARLALRHKSGYRDQNSPSVVVGGPSFYGDVSSYTVLDTSVGVGLPLGVQLTMGVKNLLDRDPPFSNQANRSQRGYDPRFTDPLGRTVFVRAAYSLP
jgi:iron complex outermembrane recepter protein